MPATRKPAAAKSKLNIRRPANAWELLAEILVWHSALAI